MDAAHTGEPAPGPVVVGVYPRQAVAVVREAAALAAALGRPLLCAYVTADSYLVEWDRAEVRAAASLHPTDISSEDERFALDLVTAVTAALTEPPPEGWSLRILEGDPSRALARVAEEAGARLIVVGTHSRGIGHALEDWLAGSVADHLAHDQDRTVVVVPVAREEELLG